ncbi:LacI family DNA-binding transcriptional regulator [Kribbella catacumbae]|uniref:LacI family DNA-binding transcriptional regulator n=1 Tax=Kribbella catacumbae TaxID=460086 RepID=UPI00036DCEDF|nr:LacI family DNA-binding transcriptional regulator [Kribbella catacumbae]
MSRPTIAGVARAAGVSVASVSRVLNGLAATEEMVERVQRAVQELGYVPDSRARSLKVGRTYQLTLAVADVGNPVYVTMMRAVEEVVSAAGYRLVVTTTGPDVVDEVALVRGMARGYADGLVISPLRVDDDLIKSIRECDVPVVVAGNVPASAGVDTIRANSPKGMLLAVEHLLAKGRRRIAFVNGPVDTVPGTARAKGFADAMKANGLSPVAEVEAVDFTFAAGREAGVELFAGLDSAGEPSGKTGVTGEASGTTGVAREASGRAGVAEQLDAVIAANDLLAVGIMHELAARDLAVPGDVAVIGMDDSELAEQSFPPLTSVNLGSAERGRRAAELLLARIEDDTRTPRRIVVQPTLSVRKSTP